VTRKQQWLALAVCGTLVMAGITLSASATSSLDRALHQRRQLVLQLQRVHVVRHDVRHVMLERLRHVRHMINNGSSRRVFGAEGRGRMTSGKLQVTLADLHRRLRRFLASIRHKTLALRAHHYQLTQWVQTYGVLRECPVKGPHDVMNNFGVIVKLPHVPRHIHEGNDIIAATGTPIVAPFDGIAIATPNKLGGQAVEVFGANGFVYNAHLSSYGQLGNVTEGTVIGYVGSTGDAGGPHDHFEWHPGNGPAVDPNPFLMAVC